ncbi:MAG: 16S rRNA (guanine(527)-N(7))-methyltransferase RsmG [Rhizobiaceae bacterium]
MSDSRLAELERVTGSVSRETFERLTAFQALFEKWSARINLAAPSTLPGMWSRHILDSAQIWPMAPDAKTWLDLGSGGGFPGIVLAILLRERPGASLAMVESSRKKAAFLRSAVAQAAAPAVVHAARIEDFALRNPGTVDVVTARALAPLPALLGLARPWLEAGATAIFHKGRDYRREIEESRDAWQFDLVEHPSVIDAASVILEINDLKKR